jgi:hypothetical protein
MATPQQFLESFLQEKTAAWAVARPHLSAVHAKFFGEPLSQHSEHYMPLERVRAVVEDVRQSDGMTTVITCEHVRRVDFRKRYRLAAAGESWKIVGIDHECFLCRGTGQVDGSRCQKCDGEGWYELDRDAV